MPTEDLVVPRSVTDFCVLHNVCLCQHVSIATKPYMCPKQTWTCREKYHRFYLPRILFSSEGKVRMSSHLYKPKHETMNQRNLSPGEDVVSGTRQSVVRLINFCLD
ncbi:uncharacterized protein PITG_02933 [Phytophthora infestans T30-4]|uniref:Uncharacterized protein n=1 Tax=Phytophthora infestans (strain T30-4) TaxID=403677 RepID=D0MXJ1_PHYIT|nr:uncharacterized protein PITG_02933 [Phytophthora infestans T30-4]EEY64354.1 hypothetical protein PITG_02933 [Phytophthora infestans T30-4]|eukprot:XP_002907790.1 hypothetical protein PITG_02933 [Phytophthora infestans T30-4]